MRARAGSAPLRLAALVVVVVAVAVVVAVSVAAVSSPVAGGSAGGASAHRPPALGSVVLPAIGFGYTVTSEGPLAASQFPSGSPSAAAAAGALSSLGDTVETFQRSWQDGSAANQVQDLVVRFPTAAGASAFVGAARRSIEGGEIVSSGPLPSIPGGRRTTYFASTHGAGVGQAITLRVGAYAAVLSFVSAATGNPAPITAASAERVAKAQYTALTSAVADGEAKPPGGGGSSSATGWAVLGAAVLALAVAIPLVLRRRRGDRV